MQSGLCSKQVLSESVIGWRKQWFRKDLQSDCATVYTSCVLSSHACAQLVFSLVPSFRSEVLFKTIFCRYNVRLDPDPCRSTALLLICILEILMNSSTSEIKSRYRSLIPITFFPPPLFPISICVVKINLCCTDYKEIHKFVWLNFKDWVKNMEISCGTLK